MVLGDGPSPLEVVVATNSLPPSAVSMRKAWNDRNGGRATPLVLIVRYEDKAAVAGPAGGDSPIYLNVDPGLVERVCIDALEQPDRHHALRIIRENFPQLESEFTSVRNSGFLATHELNVGVPSRKDWDKWCKKSGELLGKKDEELLSGLGYHIDRLDNVTSILRSGDRKVALAVLLKPAESIEGRSERFAGTSAITYALTIADRENLNYVIICQGARIRLYPTKVGVGVGRRGRTETYVECNSRLLRSNESGYLSLIFSARALEEEGSLAQLIDSSSRFAGSLAENLRDRIYGHVIPNLAQGLAVARGKRKPSVEFLEETYEMAMLVLYRLLFIAYAEDKDLLPYKWNEPYRRRSLKTKAKELLELTRNSAQFDQSESYWNEIKELFRAVDKGNTQWGIPPYNGGLFSHDPEVYPTGAKLDDVSLKNDVFGPVLRDLLLIENDKELGPVDFRSLSVREYGTIYEGLLESELSVAEMDLGIGQSGLFQPVKKGEKPLVKKGEVYLHDRSGARKSSGAYFTKSFAVEHLLEHSLEAALTDHFTRLDQLTDGKAAIQFFDFRVADISMGSGHFLVAAIDRIERRFADYLTGRHLPGVRQELEFLKANAENQLGSLVSQFDDIEESQLLRRLIARRCIYGVDINPTAVELARLSIWIHTFVPGLPLSFLNHNLVCGNSIIGVGSLDEIKEYIGKGHLPLFPIDAHYLVGDAGDALKKLGRLSDATEKDIKTAHKLRLDILESVKPAQALCDIVAANRINREEWLPFEMEKWHIIRDKLYNGHHHKRALKTLAGSRAIHFPIEFPEVFLRDRAGFDVILGNPPWEEATIEQDAFWARNFPGLRGMNQKEQEAEKKKFTKDRPDLLAQFEKEQLAASNLRAALTSGGFPGMGTGDPDLYKAFSWRFWHLIAQERGAIGVVLPRSALALKGSTEFRHAILENCDEVSVTTLLNNKQWVFPDIHPQYTIGLVACVRRNSHDPDVSLSGPFRSIESFRCNAFNEATHFKGSEIRNWTDTASLPLLPTEDSLDTFVQLRKAPRLDVNRPRQWRARPYRELDATNDKHLMDLKSEKCPKGFWPVFKGETFDIWTPDTRKYYAFADPKKVIPRLQSKRLAGKKNNRSVFSEFTDPQWFRDTNTLDCYNTRVAFRDVTNRTNQRTVIPCLIPKHVFITNKGPYFIWVRGDERDQAYLLGILSSLPLDWYARRFVETNVSLFIANAFPIPRSFQDQRLYERVVNISGRLACPDERFAGWAEAVGVEYGHIDQDVKQDMIHELDAVVALVYGLNQNQLRHIFETFHEGWDFQNRWEETLKHFKAWKKKLDASTS